MVYSTPSRNTKLEFNNEAASWLRIEIYDTDFNKITEEYCFFNITLANYSHPAFNYQSANPTKLDIEFNFIEMEYSNFYDIYQRKFSISKTKTEIIEYDKSNASIADSESAKLINYSNYQSQQDKMNKY
jgi:hypothetical protein